VLPTQDRFHEHLHDSERIFNLSGYAALPSKRLVRFLPLSGRQRKRIRRRVRLAAPESDADCLSDLVIGQRAGLNQ
jgi:hypothetical protein